MAKDRKNKVQADNVSKEVDTSFHKFENNIKSIFRKCLLLLFKHGLLLGFDNLDEKNTEFITKHKKRLGDLLFKVLTPAGKTLLLHIEIQTTNDDKMNIRMGHYRLHILEEYGDVEIIQIVFYFGQDDLKMRSQIITKTTGLSPICYLDFCCEIINIRTFDIELLLNSHVPELVSMAFLCQTDNLEGLLVRIITVLKKCCKSTKQLQDMLELLCIFAEKRTINAETFSKIMKREMHDTIVIERLPLYIAARQEGIQEGYDQAMQEQNTKIKDGYYNLHLSIPVLAQLFKMSETEISAIVGLNGNH